MPSRDRAIQSWLPATFAPGAKMPPVVPFDAAAGSDPVPPSMPPLTTTFPFPVPLPGRRTLFTNSFATLDGRAAAVRIRVAQPCVLRSPAPFFTSDRGAGDRTRVWPPGLRHTQVSPRAANREHGPRLPEITVFFAGGRVGATHGTEPGDLLIIAVDIERAQGSD